MINNYKIKSRVIKSVNGLNLHVLENNVKIKIDDILDSMVLFITALRIVEGNYLCLEKTKIENNDDNGQIFI